MKTYRRVEIRVFQQRVTNLSGEFEVNQDETRESSVETETSFETVSPDSVAGKNILSAVVRLLEEYLSD
jgi:hypothetical protein